MASNQEFATWLFENATDERVEWAIEMTLQTPNSAAALRNASSSFLDYQADLTELHGENTAVVYDAEIRIYGKQ
jgi:1,4-dihydroxy-2-naphthoyl-CoA synthase